MGSRDLFTTAASLLDCLCTTLDDTDAGRPCFCGFFIGATQMPTDSCMCGQGSVKCGTAWVRLETAFPTSTFPTQDTTPAGSCTAPVAWRFNVGVVRCTPGMDARGNPPPADAWAVSMQRHADDMQAAYRAVECCFPRHRGQVFIGAWLPVGNPDALCSGGFWPVTVWSVQ